MAVNLIDINIYSVFFQDILSNIWMFFFDNLFLILRNQLAISQFTSNFFNKNLFVNINSCPNLFKSVILLSISIGLSWDITHTLTIYTYSKFVLTAENYKASYSMAAIIKENQLTADFAQKTMELIRHGKFVFY